MKKTVRMVLLAAVVAALLCIAALAAEPTTAGIYNITGSITPKDATAASVTINETAVTDFYADTVKFDVSASGYTSGEQCLLVVVQGAKGSAAVTADTISYINQGVVGTDGCIKFTAYPQTLAKAHYCVYLISGSHAFDANSPAAEFDSYVSSAKLGDADGDDDVTVNDALKILKCIVNDETFTSTQKTAADANADGDVNVIDAVTILKYIVHSGSLGE